MNTIISKYKRMARTIALSVALPASSLMLTGCNDFLDTLPLNDVVLENYWTQKSDVTAVLNSCYESLGSKESIIRMGMWGEMRSDNIIAGSATPYEYSEMLKEKILPTYGIVKWAVMYQTINRCNTVCHYAPMVQEKDPNYTVDEMNANIAEATFIRDLCYFYLIRTFRDVPVSFEPSIDDTKDFKIPPTPMNEALDLLIADLESVKDKAVRRYFDDSKYTNLQAYSVARENSSRVTRVAIYALLADLNLWRGNWEKCIEYCDLVIDFKKEQYRLKKANLSSNNIKDLQEFYGIPLIRDYQDGSTTSGDAFTAIFGRGNSFESLFELYYENNRGNKNEYTDPYYYRIENNSSSQGHFAAYSELGNKVYDKSNKGTTMLFAYNDSRVYGTLQADGTRILKYAFTSYSNSNMQSIIRGLTSIGSGLFGSPRTSNEFANWIIYRLTEVILMKAEAKIMQGDGNFREAFNLINAVNKRSRLLSSDNKGDTLVYNNYGTSREKMEQLVIDERQRELMFEGKRWYDLVRLSLRTGNTKQLASKASEKQQSGQNAVKVKLSDINAIFLPYHKDELDLNPYLQQNSAYSNTEDFSK